VGKAIRFAVRVVMVVTAILFWAESATGTPAWLAARFHELAIAPTDTILRIVLAALGFILLLIVVGPQRLKTWWAVLSPSPTQHMDERPSEPESPPASEPPPAPEPESPPPAEPPTPPPQPQRPPSTGILVEGRLTNTIMIGGGFYGLDRDIHVTPTGSVDGFETFETKFSGGNREPDEPAPPTEKPPEPQGGAEPSAPATVEITDSTDGVVAGNIDLSGRPFFRGSGNTRVDVLDNISSGGSSGKKKAKRKQAKKNRKRNRGQK
jgi:hypothetical protein